MGQRRLSERIAAEVLLWWVRDWEPVPVNLMDISEGGMACVFPEALELHSQIELQFEFPKHGERIDSTCEVIHVIEKGLHMFQVGLKIVNLKGIDAESFSKKLGNLPDRWEERGTGENSSMG